AAQYVRICASFTSWVRELHESWTTLVLLTHDVTLVAEFCQRVVDFWNGHLAFTGACGDFFFFSSRRRHTRLVSDWSSDVCSSDLVELPANAAGGAGATTGAEPGSPPGVSPAAGSTGTTPGSPAAGSTAAGSPAGG